MNPVRRFFAMHFLCCTPHGMDDDLWAKRQELQAREESKARRKAGVDEAIRLGKLEAQKAAAPTPAPSPVPSPPRSPLQSPALSERAGALGRTVSRGITAPKAIEMPTGAPMMRRNSSQSSQHSPRVQSPLRQELEAVEDSPPPDAGYPFPETPPALAKDPPPVWVAPIEDIRWPKLPPPLAEKAPSPSISPRARPRMRGAVL